MSDEKKTYTLDEVYSLLEKAEGVLPPVLEYEQSLYLESMYPEECLADPTALIEKYADIERRLAACIGQPVVCMKIFGDVVRLEIGFVENATLRFHVGSGQYENLPVGDASVRVKGHIALNSSLEDPSCIAASTIPYFVVDRSSYFHFEERGFFPEPKAYSRQRNEADTHSSHTEKIHCDTSDWELCIGYEEVLEFIRKHPEFGAVNLLRKGVVADSIERAGAIDVTVSTPNPADGHVR